MDTIIKIFENGDYNAFEREGNETIGTISSSCKRNLQKI